MCELRHDGNLWDQWGPLEYHGIDGGQGGTLNLITHSEEAKGGPLILRSPRVDP